MRIVVKIGTNSISKDGRLDMRLLKSLVSQMAKLKREGHKLMLVSSGAIGAGTKELGLTPPLRRVPMRQAAAAVGQGLLMDIYKRLFSKHRIKIAQMLLTDEVFSARKRFLDLRNCMDELLRLDVIPIINENDPVSTDEIDKSFGDNDVLSALVAAKTEANLLIMLTTTDGIYDRDPRKNRKATLLKVIKEITPSMEKGRPSSGGRGGMSTKIAAARIATRSGVTMVVANAQAKNAVIRIAKGESLGTRFEPKEAISNKKRWISFTKSMGSIIIDKGAARAIAKGSSLLPAGIKEVKGEFKIGDVIEIVCGKTVARAQTDFSAEELDRIKGKHSKDIERILGYKSYDTVFRRENYVIIE